MAKRIARYLADFESGDAPPSSMTARVHELETRQRAIEDELANLRPVPRLPASVVEDRLAEWRRLLRASTTQGRAVVQRIVVGRIRSRLARRTRSRCPADTTSRRKRGSTNCSRAWRRRHSPDGRSLLGTEGITAADTWDADYARLLERAQKRLENRNVEWMAYPRGNSNLYSDVFRRRGRFALAA